MRGYNRPLLSGPDVISAPMRSGDGWLSDVKPTNFNTESDATLTVAQVLGGAILQGLTLTSDVTYTLPTAALLDAVLNGMDVGDCLNFYVGNNQAAAFDVIIAVGTGITAVGTNNNLTVGPQAGKMFTLEKTGTATYNLY